MAVMKKSAGLKGKAEFAGARKVLRKLKEAGVIPKGVRLEGSPTKAAAPKRKRRRNSIIKVGHMDVFTGTRGATHPIMEGRRNPVAPGEFGSTYTVARIGNDGEWDWYGNAFSSTPQKAIKTTLGGKRGGVGKLYVVRLGQFPNQGHIVGIYNAAGKQMLNVGEFEHVKREARRLGKGFYSVLKSLSGVRANPKRRPTRRNVAGFMDSEGRFHPIRGGGAGGTSSGRRAGSAYDSGRVGEAPRKRKPAAKRKPVAKRKPASKASASSFGARMTALRKKRERATTRLKRPARKK